LIANSVSFVVMFS